MALWKASTTKSEWSPDDPTAFAPTKPWKLPFITTWDGYRNRNLPTDSAEEAYLDLWWPGRCSLELCPAMRGWGLPAVATGFHSPARQTCEADFRSAPTRCWPVKGRTIGKASGSSPALVTIAG